MDGAACTLKTYKIGGRTYDRIPFQAFDWAPEIRDCNDCGVTVGMLHHPKCDLEECPACRGQAIGCGCAEQVRIRG